MLQFYIYIFTSKFLQCFYWFFAPSGADFFNYDFGSMEGIKAMADAHGFSLDEIKTSKKGRNPFLYKFIMAFGDDLPLDEILCTAMTYSPYYFDSDASQDLKGVMLFSLGVTNKKGKVLPNIQDGYKGWFRVASDIEDDSDASKEFYNTVGETISVFNKSFSSKKLHSVSVAQAMVDNTLG